MSRGLVNARHDDRNPLVDPWFCMPGPSYAVPDSLDNSGYSLSDRGLGSRLADGMIPDDVTAPLGGPVVGRLSTASYGDDTVHPVPGGALGEAGACSTPERLGLSAEEMSGLYLGPGHALKPAPLEYQGGSTPEHAMSAVGVGRAVFGDMYDGDRVGGIWER
jgi:hypothetical protein